MNTPTIALALLTFGSSLTAPVPAAATASCELHTIASPTTFPVRSQLRGQRGTVLIEVSVDSQGRATGTELIRSSGHRLLDRAATSSVLEDWRFDTSGCERKDLPATRTIAIEFRNNESTH